MTRTTGSLASSALRSTKRVWGSGPSEASTSRRTPSTMVRPRSTSPPKSAWPGVSTMFIFTPPHRTAVFLARMVMPFSRSRSPESMTRSVTSWWAPNAPVWRSMASTSVVLPWSTWATMATFLMSSRFCMGATTIGEVRAVSCRSPDYPLASGGECTSVRASVRATAATPSSRHVLIDLDRDQVPGVGPPSHDPPGWEGAGGPQRLHHRRPR